MLKRINQLLSIICTPYSTAELSLSVSIDFYRLLRTTDYYYYHHHHYHYHRHALLYNLFPRSFLYAQSKRSVNHIHRSAAIWLCYVVLYAQMFLLHYSNRGTHDVICRAYGVTPWSRRKVLVVFGTSHRTIVVKFLPKLQAPVCTSWWVMVATDRQTDRHVNTHSLYTTSFFLSQFWAQQLLRDVPADAGFPFDKTAVLGAAIKMWLCRCWLYVSYCKTYNIANSFV